MALNADTLLDRIQLKNQARRWRIAALVVGVLAVILVTEDFSGIKPGISSEYIARFTLDKLILDNPKRSKLLREIADDDSVKALILRVDTPGGSTVASEEIYLDLLRVAEQKPVVCVMRSFATSGGYMAAMGADYILAREGTITGSIGVIMQTVEISELAKNLGINPITVRSGELKGAPTPFEKFTPKHEKLIKSIINDFNEYFLSLVQNRRKLTDEQMEMIKDGRVLSAKQALELNLIDGIGGEEEALNWLEKQHNISPDLEIIDAKIPSDKKGLEKIIDEYTSSIFSNNAFVRLDGLVSIWQPAELQ